MYFVKCLHNDRTNLEQFHPDVADIVKFRFSEKATNFSKSSNFFDITKVCFKKTVTHLLLYTIANV